MADVEKVTVANDGEPQSQADGSNDGEPQVDGSTTDDDKKNSKIAFPLADAVYKDDSGEIVTALNAEGKLIAVPKPIRDAEGKVVYAGWNVKKHEPLKKEVFVGVVEFLEYQAFVSRVKAAHLIKAAEAKEIKAKNLRKFGNDSQRRKAAQLLKMREAIQNLEEQLKAEGVEVDSLE